VISGPLKDAVDKINKNEEIIEEEMHDEMRKTIKFRN
jgi:uncharacterized protein YutE (UPF0331/DUF86 family)